MAQEGLFANSEEKIDEILESIKNIARFEYYYVQSTCFRGKVNALYKTFLERKYSSKGKERFLKKAQSIEGNDVRLSAPVAVHNNYLTEARAALGQCLRSTDAELVNQNNKNNEIPQLDTTDLPDPETPLISPFDRRLDRLVVEDANTYGLIPMSTRYAQAGTIGYTVSENYIQNSRAQKKKELLKKVSDDINKMQNDDFFVGVPALMNNYAQIKLYGSKGGRYLINQKGERKWYEVDSVIGEQTLLNISQNPTTSSLIAWGNGDPYGRTPYNFSDFMFCKHWNKVPNNRLITLRRFPAPIVDNLKFPGMDGTQATGTPAADDDSEGNEPTFNSDGISVDQAKTGTEEGGSAKKIIFPPMATAVTYFGEETDNNLSDIIKFTTGFEWDEAEANVFKVTTSETPNAQQGPGALWPGFTKFATQLNVALGNWNQESVLNEGQLPPDPYEDGPYENRIIGPVNRITKVKKRKAGIKFEMSGIELKFDYVSRPFGGVNSKAVLLDILSNFLILGSTSAVFWGGQHRFMAKPQTYPFLGGDKGIQQWYSGKPLEWGASTIKEFLGKGVDAGSGILKAAKNFFNSILGKPGSGNKDLFGSLENVYGGGTGIAGNLVKQYAAEKSEGQIPYLQGLKALLIGEPVGEWHVTIGNPLNPIAMIGNLVCDSVEVEFGNELGPDDFPLEMRVTVKLEHGMARDRDAIQSIFNRGMGRIYDLPDSFRGSAEGETAVDKRTGNAPDTGRNPVYYRVPIANSQTVGGKFGTGKTVDNAMQGNVSVWNRSKYTAVSPNANQIIRTKDNPLFRSSFRAVDWVALKSLK